MNQLPENLLRTYDVTLVTSYLIGLCLTVSDSRKIVNIKCSFLSNPIKLDIIPLCT